MLKMLTDAVKWFSNILGGSLDSPFTFDPNQPTLPQPETDIPDATELIRHCGDSSFSELEVCSKSGSNSCRLPHHERYHYGQG